MTVFAERLKKLRESRGLMQKSVAAELNIGNTTLSNYEQNVSSPSPEVLVAIADYFGTSTDYLLGRTDDPSPVTSTVGAAEKELLSAAYGLAADDLASLTDYARFLAAKRRN